MIQPGDIVRVKKDPNHIGILLKREEHQLAGVVLELSEVLDTRGAVIAVLTGELELLATD